MQRWPKYRRQNMRSGPGPYGVGVVPGVGRCAVGAKKRGRKGELKVKGGGNWRGAGFCLHHIPAWPEKSLSGGIGQAHATYIGDANNKKEENKERDRGEGTMGNANVNASSGGGSSSSSSSSNRHQKGGGGQQQHQHQHHRSIDDDDGSRGGKGKSEHHHQQQQQHRQHGGGNAVVVHGDEEAGRLGPMAYGESMLHSPPDSPSSVSRSPLMFTPQIPMVPINRGEFTLGPYQSNMCDPRELGNVHEERGVPTMIVWSYGGNNVSVEGSWDNWRTRQPLQKVGKDFMIVKTLPSGVYQYKIILDKDWHYPEEVHAAVLNHLDVKDYVPENLDSVAGFEPPSSPVSSYSNTYPSPEDFAKEPPALPSHLHLTLLNVPPFEEASGLLPRPQHVTLNHLYVEKGKNLRSVLALGLTHRYRSKYVTVALYKPIHK